MSVAERELIGKNLPGFFPTPRPVIEEMLEHALIGTHSTVLEPSCGKGDIVAAIMEAYPNVRLTAIEKNQSLADVLGAKGIEVEIGDFLEHTESYDRIVMNPPFEKGQDISHVRHAYELLAPGGRLVAIMSVGSFLRADRKAVEFQEWHKALGAQTIKLVENAFNTKDAFRQTGVRTRMIILDKEANATG